jgi:tetratricopeptide (TPR) repeat protein
MASAASAAPVQRSGAISGRIVAKKQGETAVLLPTPAQRPAEVRQDLKAGDVLRTNAAGTLAIVFADRTQVRIGRNSTLVVKQVRAGVPSSVTLQRGSLWARSPRGASQLSVETPSATAAIRGTEYSIVASDEQTTLTVVEGQIDFFNPQGQLQVTAGQSAAARLGAAPTRIVTVNPDSREQMLYYLSLDGALSSLQPTQLPQVAARSEVARIKALAPEARSTEDWLALAECGVGVERQSTVEEALAKARSMPLSPIQDARAKTVEATLATKSRDYVKAKQLLEEAYPVLTGRQREIVGYAMFIANALADPQHAEGEPPALNPSEGAAYTGQAFMQAYLGDFDKARALAEEGIRRFPDESELYGILAGIGILTGDDKAMDAASRAALKVDPGDPFANRVQTELELHYRGNPQGAIANARRGVEIAPGDDEAWNVLSQSLMEWGQGRQAERAIKQGIAEAPNSFVLHGNYALFLFQQQRIAEARRELAIARALDPDNAVAHLAEGFFDLSDGKFDDALAHGLDASAANPSYGEVLLLLAEIYYNQGEYELAAQQVDAADRADPNSPFVALYRAAFAIDSYRADEAIIGAREALRRYRARGGVYASLSESKGSGSYIAGAFRFLGLEEWARYYGDRTFDPFVSATLFDRALSGVPRPYVYRHSYDPFDLEAASNAAAVSDIFQGIRLDPLGVAGPEKGLQLTRQKFVELSVAPSLVASGHTVSLSQTATLNATVLAPVPIALNVTATHDRLALPTGTNNRRRGNSVQAFAGAKLTPYDNLVVNAGWTEQSNGLPGTDIDPRDNGRTHDRSTSIYGIYAHEFDRENVATIGGGYIDATSRLDRLDSAAFLDPENPDNILAFASSYRQKVKSNGWFALANYAVGVGEFDLQMGGEYFSTRATTDSLLAIGTATTNPPTTDRFEVPFNQSVKAAQYRGYADVRFVPSNSLVLQAQVGVSGLDVKDGPDNSRLDFSGGAAFAPAENHWLRAAYVRSANTAVPLTMAPTAVVGLRQADAPLPAGARSESLIGRWEAEWSSHVFTAVEWQDQRLAALSFDRPNVVDPFPIAFPVLDFGPRALDVGRSRLDRVSASASVWLTGNIGLRGNYAFTDSEVREGVGAGGPVPFTPRHFARGQITWTHASRVKVDAGISYLGPRLVDLDNTRAPHAWVGDLQLTLESSDQSMQFTAGVFNLLDEDVAIAPGINTFGRTLAASLDFRF